ncbi:hypothetical protein [Rhizobium rhizogenes]|uniref:hypothetical protein n=1 Tax=Rhizobium rhizogenes TaxID=359 RepID=UPI0009BFC6D5|nr:hypothetical protein [Rhizobium rhizogenes]MQB33762.1 hypothetical protein [Rhizobium rhizogenes]NTG88228.1 hypothetical protein [Rhizobium rhizogenes]NTH20411.1 hypothetical protein [Rhizobium rhizogenes]NTH33420.1 hypothetical protein [Rhizobium rhizogenes]NTI43403.1 hypothetical protein [Rhizobium rhizogenes]
MIRILVLFCVASTLGGCASLSYPLPKCDGYSRRPLNRAMWQWDGDSRSMPQPPNSSPALSGGKPPAYVEAEPDIVPAAFAHFDVGNSYRPCGGPR